MEGSIISSVSRHLERNLTQGLERQLCPDGGGHGTAESR